MQRLFVPPPLLPHMTLTAEQSHQMLRVMRMKPNDPLMVLDGLGNGAVARIFAVSDGLVEIKTEAPQKILAEPSIKVTLFQGLPKADKLEWIVQKSVELGVFSVQPVVMAHSIAKGVPAKLPRLQTIAREAAEQAERGIIPQVFAPMDFAQACEKLKDFDRVLVCQPGSEAGLAKPDAGGQTVALIIGPEGGISPAELTLLEQAGGVAVGLGPRVLRTETAGLAALAALFFAAGEWA